MPHYLHKLSLPLVATAPVIPGLTLHNTRRREGRTASFNINSSPLLTLKMLNHLKIIKDVFAIHIISWILFDRRRPTSQWSNPTYCLPYTDNTMPADALATLGARASAAVVLTPQSQNILFPGSEELRPSFQV